MEPSSALTLSLSPVNANVYSVHVTGGAHVGNLKRIGMVWKFKAIGYDSHGAIEPGGGPLTGQHNMEFVQPDALELNTRLSPLVHEKCKQNNDGKRDAEK